MLKTATKIKQERQNVEKPEMLSGYFDVLGDID